MTYLFLLRCSSSELINSSNVKNISISKNSNKTIVYNLSDKAKINSFIKKINSAKREIRKFYAEYTVEIVYENGSKDLILVKSKYIKLNGLTYCLSEDLQFE